MEIREGGLDHPAVAALLRLHLAAMHADSPPGSVHALDLSKLQRPDVRFWGVWEGDALLGCGAMRLLDSEHGEVKSMRTAPEALRRGVGARLVTHIIEVARTQGLRRLSLETGSAPPFAPAHALYARFGFVPCDAFGDYTTDDPFSRFLTLEL
jgi:putative acetyltransferase